MTVKAPDRAARAGLALSAAKWAAALAIAAANLYVDFTLVLAGDLAFPLLDAVIVGLGIWIFMDRRMHAQKYAFPAIAGMIAFIIFPLAYTVYFSFTNYSGRHIMTARQAMLYHMREMCRLGESEYPLTLVDAGGGRCIIAVSGPGGSFRSDPAALPRGGIADDAPRKRIRMHEAPPPSPGEAVPVKDLFSHRMALMKADLLLPDGRVLALSSLWKFAEAGPRYARAPRGSLADGIPVLADYALYDNKKKALFVPNMETGFYQYADAHGRPSGEEYSPGFRVGVGIANYLRFFQSAQGPFLRIFVWTVAFALGTVAIQLAIGLLLACLVQWPFLRGRSVYRVLLMLPYAVPSFISILVFKGLFNQHFGEVNIFLKMIMEPALSLFGLQWQTPDWFSDPHLARVMLLLVNAWLGYPYMMILCMGLLKSIPDDLYDASAIEGASPWQNLRFITLPLLMRPLAPLLIASFAYNFNNFVLIKLLTGGGPDFIDSDQPAGYTDLLVSFTYRIAFEGGRGNDYGLAAAIATVIFLLVGVLCLPQLFLARRRQGLI
ncbi:MAG: maltose ABC transporter permease MalF [Succinivibrio sp.]